MQKKPWSLSLLHGSNANIKPYDETLPKVTHFGVSTQPSWVIWFITIFDISIVVDCYKSSLRDYTPRTWLNFLQDRKMAKLSLNNINPINHNQTEGITCKCVLLVILFIKLLCKFTLCKSLSKSSVTFPFTDQNLFCSIVTSTGYGHIPPAYFYPSYILCL